MGGDYVAEGGFTRGDFIVELGGLMIVRAGLAALRIPSLLPFTRDA
jgi:hypothetical protein